MIIDTDIKYRLSGGANNLIPDNSLGGDMSSTEVVDGDLNNLFDIVSGDESADGCTEYRCMYVLNTSAQTLYNAKVYVLTQTNSPTTEIEIGTDVVDVTTQTIADETTAPVGITFGEHYGKLNAIEVGDIGAGEKLAVWVKWIVNAGTTAVIDTATIRVFGDTDA